MSGFATGISAESVLKNGISLHILRFFWRIYRSTRPTDLFSNWRYNNPSCYSRDSRKPVDTAEGSTLPSSGRLSSVTCANRSSSVCVDFRNFAGEYASSGIRRVGDGSV